MLFPWFHCFSFPHIYFPAILGPDFFLCWLFVRYNHHCSDFWINRNLTHHLPQPVISSASLDSFRNTKWVLCVQPHFLPSVNTLHWLRQPFSGALEAPFSMRLEHPPLQRLSLLVSRSVLYSGTCCASCFVLFIYSHGIRSTLHQK